MQKWLSSTACIFCIGHQYSKSNYYVHLWYMFSWCAKQKTFYLENCRRINRATVASWAFQAAELCREADRLRLVGGYIHAKGATFWQPPAIFNHFNNKIFLLENPVIIRINSCLTYSTILKILLKKNQTLHGVSLRVSDYVT